MIELDGFPNRSAPTQAEPFRVGPASRLYEKDDPYAQMRRRRVKNAVLLLERKHLLDRPLAQLVEMLYGASWIVRVYSRRMAKSSKHVRHSGSRFTVAHLRGTLIPKRRLQTAIITIFFDQLRCDSRQHQTSENAFMCLR